jgi:hypothetical protein
MDSCDVLIGFAPLSHNPEALAAAIAHTRETVLAFSPAATAVVVYPDYLDLEPSADARWRLLPSSHLMFDPGAPAQSISEGFRAIFDSTKALGAKACAVIASDPSAVTGAWAAGLLQPALQGGFDLVAPCYARHPFEGVLNRSVIYPLTRALYGKQVRNPLGPDFGLSARLLERVMPLLTSGALRNRLHPLASLTAEAVTAGMNVCQSHLGTRIYSSPDDVSSVLVQVMNPLFADVERYAPQWQRVRGSQPVPEYGQAQFVPNPGSPVDVRRLYESFQIGTRNLRDIWSLVLPPSTLVELARMARASAETFRMPDAMWARIVYDFALAWRVRAISRDHLLRAMTPLYLGWVASYAREVEQGDYAFVEGRLEESCMAWESAKSYLVSRWRWPDRFNP